VIQRTDLTDEIVTRICGAIRPWRIVLFGSRARGDHREESDYDIYVEADEDEEVLKQLDSRIRRVLPTHYRVDVKLDVPGAIERRRDDPGTIEWDVARQGRVLFADPQAPRTLAPPARVREQPTGVPESVAEWLDVAERDWRHCLLLRDQGSDYSPEICFYSHQACEKYMKALLVSRRVRPERTHELPKLLTALRAAGCDLPLLDADCELLTKHAITPRYPVRLKLGVEDAAVAFAAAERIVTAVRTELPPTIAGTNQ
jgi:HEPN domain-containing protein/predicted nucleotidyltransferase